MKKYLYFVITLILFISTFSSCTYTPPKQYSFDKSAVINKSFDVVWGRIIQWFGNNNTPIKTIEKASGLISTEFNLSAAHIKNAMDCGKAAAGASLIDHTGNFNIIVENINDNSTKVTINAFFSCYQGDLNTVTLEYRRVGNKLNCNSTGLLEKEIIEFIKQ